MNAVTKYHVAHATAEPLLQRLEGVQKSGNGWRARCPACGGKSRKLAIAERDDRVLIFCFDCGDAGAVLDAVGLGWADLQPPRHWPLSPEERKAGDRAIRDAGMAAAIDVLATEASVLCFAAQDLAAGQPLSEQDADRLALAYNRIGNAAVVLTGKDTFRPEHMHPPVRLVSIKRQAVDELRRELDVAERELQSAQRALEAFEQRRAAA